MSDVPDTINLAQILADIEAHTEIRYPVLYDPELRARYAAAQERVDAEQSKLAAARKRQEAAAESAYMTEVPTDLDEGPLLEAQSDLDDVTDAAQGKRLVAVFRGQTSDYDDWVAEAVKAEAIPQQVFRLYCERAWKRLETPDGAPVDATLADVVDGLMTAGDRMAVGRKIIAANEGLTTLPF